MSSVSAPGKEGMSRIRTLSAETLKPVAGAGLPSWAADNLDSILLSADEIQERIGELAVEVASSIPACEPLTLICVLKGAEPTFSGLVKALAPLRAAPTRLEFIRLSSYRGTESTGSVALLGPNLLGQRPDNHFLVVEDIVETGKTIAALKPILQQSSPRSVKVLTLLRKKTPKSDGYEPDFIGFDIPDKFVIGFGLDYNQVFRELPCIAIINEKGIEKYKD